MIPDSVAVLLLILLLASWIYIRHLQVTVALAYLEGFLDRGRALEAKTPDEVYDWAEEGL